MRSPSLLLLIGLLAVSAGSASAQAQTSPSEPKTARSWIADGAAAFAMGKSKEAVAAFTEAIRLDPNLADAYFRRASVYASLRNFDKAVSDANKGIELQPKMASNYMRRAHIYRAMGAHDQAIADLDTAIRILPDYWFAFQERAKSHLAKGDYDKALADSEKALADAKSADAWLMRGRVYAATGRNEKAIADFSKAIELDETSSGLMLRADLYAEIGEYGKAIDDYHAWIEFNPFDGESIARLGGAYTDGGMLDEGIRDFSDLISYLSEEEVSPLPAHNERGKLYRATGAFDKALQDFSKVMGGAPDYLDAYLDAARTYLAMGEHDKGMALLAKPMSMAPDEAPLYSFRAALHEAARQYDKALADYDKAVALDRSLSARIYSLKAAVLVKVGRLDDALQSATVAVEANVGSASAFILDRRARVYRARKEWRLAIEDYSTALKRARSGIESAGCFSGRANANKGLGNIDAARSDAAQAVKHAQDAVDAGPRNVHRLYGLAYAYAGRADCRESAAERSADLALALDALKRAVSTHAFTRETVDTDSNFDALRGDVRFKEIVESLR